MAEFSIVLADQNTPSDSNVPRRLKRSESFLGIHFDFHAGAEDTKVGENVTPQMVQNIIDKVRPDFIQVDTKGHGGYSSYPTAVGTRAGGFVRDPLKIWREVTAKNGVALYAHHSGVFDISAVRLHPDWACVNADGKPDDQMTSVFGDYKDKQLIGQLKELCGTYGLDGVWLDGECWALKPDYGTAAVKEFKKESGLTYAPTNPSDPNYQLFAEFNREGFRRYLRHYIGELKRFNPAFQVASNWAFTTMMPEPVTADVDFLSGDYVWQNSVNSARLEARFLRSQNKPWDLMAWGFINNDAQCFTTKTARQLEQEAAIVLALGGGFQVYFRQKRDASIFDWEMDVMGEVAKFCRARQPYCHQAQPVKEIAVLLSKESLYREASPLLGFWGQKLTPIRGTLCALLNSQFSVDVVAEHHLPADTIDKWPLIVIPEWPYLSEEFCGRLLAYVKRGGRLLVIGADTAKMFEDSLGAALCGDAQTANRWLAFEDHLAGIHGKYQPVRLSKDTAAFGALYAENDFKSVSQPAASVRDFGKGTIAAMYFDFGQSYYTARTIVAREFLNALVRKLYQPLVDVEGSHQIDVSVNRIGNTLAVGLVNTGGPHENKSIYTFDEIPPAGPLTITIHRLKGKPKGIHLEPSGVKPQWSYRAGEAKIALPQIDIYEILMVE